MTTQDLSADDLRYLSMIAWRVGTQRAEEIATRVDALLLAQGGPGVDDESWVPPYVRVRPGRARTNWNADERARQADARKHFDVV